jgi:hypothetical protein
MKKLFTVLVAIALIASFASAQEGKGITGYGPKIQLNFATIGGDNTSGYSSTTLIGFGGFLINNVAEEFDIQAEAMYDQKGCEIGSGSLTLGYIELNGLAKYLIPMEGDIKPTVFAGPSIGILVSATGNPGSVDMKDQFEGLDYGLIFGAGASMNVGDGSILFDVRYNLGLANILKIGGSVLSQKNQVIGISVGYAFL